MKRRWLWGLVPVGLGLVAALVLNFTSLSNPIIVWRVDLGTAIFLFGLLLSGGIVLVVTTFQRFSNILDDVMREAAQDRRRFIRLLDHELKNPLTAIMAGLANLTDGHTDEQRRTSLDSVESQVLRLSRLVSDLRKLSDLEIRELELAQVKLSDVLSDAFEVAVAKHESEERKLNLLLPQAPWPLPTITADRDLLFLAILNLLDNAIKFSKPEDTVELRASEDAGEVVIEIADTGPGIPEEEVGKVWQELYRGKGAQGIPGSGLGLALVRGIIKRHHGDISIRSRAGQGTLVTVRLPSGDVTRS
jgi:two-component system OmpR family sensor kinase